MARIGMMRMKRSGWHRRMGLTFYDGHALAYGHEHGALMWAPEWVKHAIVAVWNSIFCMIHGHDTMLVDLYKVLVEENPDEEPPSCSRCCSELPVDGVYVQSKEPWWKKAPSKEEIASWKELAEQPDPPEDFPDPS